jgi:ABC-2 type transport system permease protein
MKPFWALIGKQVHESRWTLAISASALFGLGWLSVYATALNEAEIGRLLASGEGGARIQWMRNLGILDEPTSISIMMAFWNHPFFLILVSIWGIMRGSAAVAAEIERGTMDLILSRPVSRTAYLTSQVCVALSGFAILAAALAAGGALALRYNVLRDPPAGWLLLKPAINLAALGLPVYGYTLLASSIDWVRWRPSWIGSTLTLGGFIAYVIAMIPVFRDMWWRPYLERISIFHAYNPVELVAKGETLEFNLTLLAGIGTACVALAFTAFGVRDVPANA